MSEHEINRREATLMGLMFAGVGGVASLSEAFAQETPESSDLIAEIEVELRKQEEIWNSQDYQRIRELWDHDDPEPYFRSGRARPNHYWLAGAQQIPGANAKWTGRFSLGLLKRQREVIGTRTLRWPF